MQPLLNVAEAAKPGRNPGNSFSTFTPPPGFFGSVDSTGSLSPTFSELLILLGLQVRFLQLLTPQVIDQFGVESWKFVDARRGPRDLRAQSRLGATEWG